MSAPAGTGERLVLDPVPTNVARARSWLADSLTRGTKLSVAQIEAATIMISELVTNVFRHTTSKAVVTFEVVQAEVVQVGVADEDDLGEPQVQPFDPLRVGGNGLRIVDAMAQSWSVDHHPSGGKTVWFTLTPNRT